MSTTTNNNKKTADEKIAAKDSRIKQLQKEKQAIIKRENAKARKERNHRLYYPTNKPMRYSLAYRTSSFSKKSDTRVLLF